MSDDDEQRNDPAREGLEHLQTAAREMIAAARSMLDACEELLEDPRAASTLSTIVGTVGRMVGGLAGAGAPPSDPDDEPRVQRIRVS